MFRMGEAEVKAVERVLMSHQLFRIGGQFQEVNNFEREFREKMKANHCLCLASGTGALDASWISSMTFWNVEPASAMSSGRPRWSIARPRSGITSFAFARRLLRRMKRTKRGSCGARAIQSAWANTSPASAPQNAMPVMTRRNLTDQPCFQVRQRGARAEPARFHQPAQRACPRS